MEKAIIPPEKKPYQEIGDDLRAQIAQGRYPVGSRLPPERHIAETYGVSRTIVREALLMLELQGTVDIRQGSGVYVMRIPHENDSEEEQLLSSDVLVRLKFSSAPAAGEQYRRLCRENGHPRRYRQSEADYRAGAAGYRSQRYRQDNARLFHLVLAGATQNQMLLATVERIWLQMDSSPLWQQFNVHIASRAWRLKWLGDRQTLLAALRRRDVMGAWQAMWQHLENVKNSLLELSDEDAPDFDGYLFDSVPIFQGSWYDDPAAVRRAAVRPAGDRLAVAGLWRQALPREFSPALCSIARRRRRYR